MRPPFMQITEGKRINNNTLQFIILFETADSCFSQKSAVNSDKLTNPTVQNTDGIQNTNHGDAGIGKDGKPHIGQTHQPQYHNG